MNSKAKEKRDTPFAAQTVAGIRVEGNAIGTVVEAGYI